jgi:hypothetical protein
MDNDTSRSVMDPVLELYLLKRIILNFVNFIRDSKYWVNPFLQRSRSVHSELFKELLVQPENVTNIT